mgnify:CR=1 FL=1
MSPSSSKIAAAALLVAALAIPLLMHLRDKNEETPTRFPSNRLGDARIAAIATAADGSITSLARSHGEVLPLTGEV